MVTRLKKSACKHFEREYIPMSNKCLCDSKCGSPFSFLMVLTTIFLYRKRKIQDEGRPMNIILEKRQEIERC